MSADPTETTEKTDPEKVPPPHEGGAPHDKDSSEPLGPFTPDDESEAGDTPEVHDKVTPHDLRPGTSARQAAEEMVGEDGATRGNQ